MAFLSTPTGPIYFEQRGPRAATPLLLVHGVGCQCIHWPETLLDELVSLGFRVIYFDNRDVGLSLNVDTDPPTIEQLVGAQQQGSTIAAPYSLSDMADDVVHLLNHVGQSGAHVVGVSMGGMIAQRLAINHPKRVFSLTSIMSTTGNPEVGGADPEAVMRLAGSFMATDRETVIKTTIESGNFLGGEHYPSREMGIARVAERAFDRAYRPEGTLRQFAAILSDGDRREALARVTVPTLAIHGTDDPLVDQSGSEDLVNVVRNAELKLIENLGHDLSEPVLADIASWIRDFTEKSRVLR